MPSLLFAALAVAVTLFQAAPAPKPDFSGNWTMDRSRSQSPELATLTIKHTATEISIETAVGTTTSVKIYPFEMSAHAAKEAITSGHSHANWDGASLVTETSGNIQGQTVSYKQTRSMNSAGTEMTVESIVIVQHGYAVADSKNYATAKDVYVRLK
jgi:hypothetical protein